MKTTIKFDYLTNQPGGKPIIKIVQPVEVFQNNPDLDLGDLDPRDILARQILNPDYEPANKVFVITHNFGVPHDNPTHYISWLEPVAEREFSEKFRWQFMSRYIPFNLLHDLENPKETNKAENPSVERRVYMDVFKKFNEFFDYVDGLTKPVNCISFCESSSAPKKLDIPLETIRDYFELKLTSEYRLKAFKNADKSTLDLPAKNLFDAIVKSTHNDVGSTPEGSDFWINAINECGCSI